MTEYIKKSLRESARARWLAMVFVSVAMFGAYYFNYALSPLKPMLESALEWTSSDFGVYTSSYAWFNVYLFMLIFSGIILDKLGIRLTGLWSTILSVVGTGINYWAIIAVFPEGAHVSIPLIGDLSMQVFWSSIGFTIFGVGTEAAGITVTKAIVRWFKGKEMALAMGLQMSIARLGTALAIAISLPLAINYNYSTPILLAFILMSLGVLSFIVFMVMDKKLDASEADEIEEEEPFRLKDIIKIIGNLGFWYIAILCVLFYGAVFPFLYYATDFMINKYHVAPKLAGLLPSLLPFGTIFLTPFFGGIYDKKGKGATIMLIGSVMLIVVHGLMSVPFLDHWLFAAVMIVFLGIAFSLVPSAMWPAVPKIIPEKQLGTAYAVIFWIQNIGLMLIPLLLGLVLESTNPSVATNKVFVKESIEASYNSIIADNNIQIDKKELKDVLEKTTTSVIDSLVQNTYYEAAPQEQINTTDLSEKIVQANLAGISGSGMKINSAEDIEKATPIFVAETFTVVNDAKLNLRYNYQADILIFTLLGILSVIIALLLKKEDKRKGYGLELPNITQ